MNPFVKQKWRHRGREQTYVQQRGKTGWGELRDWDGHIYITDTMLKISS